MAVFVDRAVVRLQAAVHGQGLKDGNVRNIEGRGTIVVVQIGLGINSYYRIGGNQVGLGLRIY